MVSGPSGTGAGSEWAIERRGSSIERWSARDTDGDGTWDAFDAPGGTFTRPTESSPQRWLVVCLDGVPLAAMQALWDSGRFREFLRPTATVSTLPSDSETALTAALHAAPVPGYEHRTFDRAANAMRGGAWVTLTGAGIPYIRKLDYDTPGWAKALPYVLPEKTYRADLGRFRRAFSASRAPVFFAHIASSDAVLHIWTSERASPLLAEFDDVLREIYLDAHGTLGVVVFSDHGDNETPSRAAPLEEFLASRGWHIGGTLNGARNVVIPSYGLVGFAAVYCEPESVEQLAEDLRGVEGADAIISRAPGGGARIRAAHFGATGDLEWSADGGRYRYRTRGGDPLGLAAVFDALRARGKLDADGFASDADLWSATALAANPDAAARIRGWATDEVRNRADILVSLAPGYYHGAGIFPYIVDLAGTHGGIEKSATLGFAMATYPLPAAVRVGDVIPARLREAAAANRRE